jgi:hypothetical protein
LATALRGRDLGKSRIEASGMKDQYFGDINDYREYGILRQLASLFDRLR